MGLLDNARTDNQQIIEGDTGASVPVLITSPPIQTGDILPNTVFGTLDPEDVDNQIRGWPGDHYTQVDIESGAPQAGLNAHITLHLKTLLDKGVIEDIENPKLNDFIFSWLDINDSTVQRNFLVDRILPTRSLFHIVIILGEIEITP